MSGPEDSDFAASPALLTAALGGLLCLAAGCSDSSPAAGEGCSDGVVGAPRITASETIADLSLETFTADCDKRNGTVEVHPHCGGVNGCRGISYDSDSDTRTEHTCRGANTCTGFSCVVCD